MTPTAIASLSCVRGALLAAPFIALVATPAAAQREVTDQTVTAMDVARTPLEDLNLARDPIPPVLQRARSEPYRNPGFKDCVDVRSEIGDLDAVLGEDFDTAPPDQRGGRGPGGIAQQVVATLIPFRGVIRELSGANQHEWEFRQSIAAGMMRRAYLKGLGQAMGCPYPARPAPPEMIAAAILRREEAEARREEEDGDREERSEGSDNTSGFVSEPVVQPLPRSAR